MSSRFLKKEMRNSIFIVCFGRHSAGKCNAGPLSTYFHSWTQSKTAVQPVKATKSNEHHAVDEISEEWKTAKPFEQIPSHPSYPVFGTAWVFLPLIGMLEFYQNIILLYIMISNNTRR